MVLDLLSAYFQHIISKRQADPLSYSVGQSAHAERCLQGVFLPFDPFPYRGNKFPLKPSQLTANIQRKHIVHIVFHFQHHTMTTYCFTLQYKQKETHLKIIVLRLFSYYIYSIKTANRHHQ